MGLIVPPWLTSKSEFTQEEDGRPTLVIMFQHFFAKLPLPLNRFFSKQKQKTEQSNEVSGDHEKTRE